LVAIWALCFLLFFNDWNVSQLLAGTALSFLQSWRLFAAFALLGLLYRLQAEHVVARAGMFARGRPWAAW
jgi:hypothetical protein